MPFPLYPPQTIVHWLMIKLLSRHRLLPLVVEGYVRHIKPNRVRLLTNDFQNRFGLGAMSSLKHEMFNETKNHKRGINTWYVRY